MTNDEAILLAKWANIDLDMSKLDECFFRDDRWLPISSFIDWLHSAEGERALLDRLSELGFYVNIYPFDKRVAKKYSHQIILEDDNDYYIRDHVVTTQGETRIAAIITACLEVA